MARPGLSRVAVTAGLAEWPKEESPDEVMRKVDGALYESKTMSRR